MRSCAAALVVLAVVTECLGASDRSRHRSSSRNTPVASKRQQVDFDCPEEFGYYPHPTDCTLYYVCVFGGALLESCTGGLMYSHELQTCDWPRNVGCDAGVSAAGGDEVERLIEREPPRPAPRRNPPPPPRAQPNPVITSRGQPKFNRDEYEKQQQLYAEVDDLPPVEEIENDRQQRVYRGQPSTIGQVQKDRDGYASQIVSSGRNFNNNIIPASIPQNSGKIGSFSFGSQVDDRRAATITQAPQTYSDDDILTDFHHDRRFDIETNDIDGNNMKERASRKKREVTTVDVGKNETRSNSSDELTKRNDSGESMEYFEIMTESDTDDDNENKYSLNDSERGKRQVRYYLKNGYKSPSKNWVLAKPIKFIEIPQQNYNPNSQSGRYQNSYSNANNNNYYDHRPQYTSNSNLHSAVNPFLVYQMDNSQSQRPFKASLPDNNKKHPHNPLNVATQIITKSPPISALGNNENPFSSHPMNNGYNNYQGNNQFTPITNRPNSQIIFQDFKNSVSVQTSPRPQNKYQNQNEYIQRPAQNDEPESESEEEEDDEEEYSDENEDDKQKHDYPKPPYEFTHPSNKYASIENPFANPNFDFDAYLSKLSNGQYTTQKAQNVQSSTPRTYPVEITPVPHQKTESHSSTLRYDGMSTPRPFSVPSGPEDMFRPVTPSVLNQANNQYIQRPHTNQQYQQQSQTGYQNAFNHQQQQNVGVYRQNAGIPLEAQRPKLKPPNFKDDRQLPISYSFSKPVEISLKPNQRLKENQQFSVTSKPYIYVTSTGNPFIVSSPKPYAIKSEKNVSPPQHQASVKPYAQKPYSTYITIKSTSPNPLSTLANEQLRALQQFWQSSTEPVSTHHVTMRPSTTPDHAKLGNLFAQAVRTSMQTPTIKNQNMQFPSKASTTTVAPKRRPIPKPSPEMTDYYYDEDEYYEPPVKSQYMPSTEVKPQRPFMAQNYKEYDDDSYEDSQEQTVNIKPRPNPDASTKNHNDVSIITKTPQKDYKYGNSKINVPVLVNFASPKPTVLIRPEVSSYEIIHRNRTMHIRKPLLESGPNTLKPPKYLNQTTLRPYTVRHRLAKPTAVIEPTASSDEKPSRGRGKHPNIVAQMLSTPRDSHNQETRFTKTKHDGRTNSLEPTESVAPSRYSPSPRPKMLYNGSQNYNPDQYDPYYAIYDEDGELYKDADYVQQYNTASLQPAVQQTYRGTPPPARRPVEAYSPRPVSPDDYDDALIQGQISNQNQYQPPIRQSTRGEGNELGYDHNPSSVKTTLYEAPSTAPQTTSTSTTQRSTSAPYTEAMTPLRYTPRSSTVETPIPESSYHNSSDESVSSYPVTPSSVINFSSLAKPFEKTDNLYRLEETISTTETIASPRRASQVTNNNDQSVEVVRSNNEKDKRKVLSLTTGFSIRRNSNNTNNPYTLTLLSRPYEHYSKPRRNGSVENTNSKTKNNPNSNIYDSSSDEKRGNSETKNNPNRYDYDSSSDEKRDNSATKNNPNRYVYDSSSDEKRGNSETKNNPNRYVYDSSSDEKRGNSATKNNSNRYVYDSSSDEKRDNSETKNNPNEYVYDSSSDEKRGNSETKNNPNKYVYASSSDEKRQKLTESRNDDSYQKSSENPVQRKDSQLEINEEYDIPVHIRAPSRTKDKVEVKSTTSPTTTKYYLKSVIKRPAPFSKDDTDQRDSSENIESVGALIEAGLQNARPENEIPDESDASNPVINITPRSDRGRWKNYWNEPAISQYKTFDNIRNYSRHENLVQIATTSVTPTTIPFTSTTAKRYDNSNSNKQSRGKSSYYSYRLEDEVVPDQTTEVLSGKVKNVIKAFLDFSSPSSKSVKEFTSSTLKPSTLAPTEPNVVNIGFYKKPVKYNDEKPSQNNVKRLQIITEPSVSRFFTSSVGKVMSQDFSSSTSDMSKVSFINTTPAKTPLIIETSTLGRQFMPRSEIYQSKFNNFMTNAPQPIVTTTPTVETSRKFLNIIKVEPNAIKNVNFADNDEPKQQPKSETIMTSEIEWHAPSVDEIKSEIASTTSTTKSTTTTIKTVPTTKSTKSVSFPTRTSRINPAIKLAASNLGSGRRSYQSSSKCSSDNSLQDPKCNEIKYQRPTSTRGRGSAHYSTLNGNNSPQQTPNRGTPPTRSRPTLKPSTAIVSENTKFVDIYANPPSRPAPVYPQPTVDKTAAKCRKDVCLLPDCSCGGKDIPGNLPVNEVPQIVLITFDDAVNDLNKPYYEELFERGRVNPNGCPISATFYASHEWTDYSQVQNLYADGHEFASHTISHSFGEQFSQKKWNREVGGQREILAAYGGVKLEDVRGMRSPFLSIGGNKMFKMLYDSNFTYDSSMPVYENRPPSWPYTLDYKLFHDCMIPPCPTKSYPGVWEVPMVMWQDLNGGRCSMGDACANPPEAEGVYKMLLKNFDRHYTTNRAPFGLFYHAAWFTQAHHKDGFIMFLDFINQMQDVYIVTNWQALQWVRDPTPISRMKSFQPFQCNYQDRPKKCNNPKVCNLWHKSGVRYMRTCQPCPEVYPWTGKTGIRSSRIDNDNGE